MHSILKHLTGRVSCHTGIRPDTHVGVGGDPPLTCPIARLADRGRGLGRVGFAIPRRYSHYDMIYLRIALGFHIITCVYVYIYVYSRYMYMTVRKEGKWSLQWASCREILECGVHLLTR